MWDGCCLSLSLLKKWTTDGSPLLRPRNGSETQDDGAGASSDGTSSERGSAVVLKSLCGFGDGRTATDVGGAEYVVSERQKMLRQNAKSSQDNCGLSGTLAENLAAHVARSESPVDIESNMRSPQCSCLRRRLQKSAD